MLSFLVRRLSLMMITVFVITVVSFFIIILPPGDFVDRIVLEANQYGEVFEEHEIADLRRMYGLDQSAFEQYLIWMGNILFRGDFGYSFGWDVPVSELIFGMGLTTTLSIVTLMFIWIVAIPIGIYSAVRVSSRLRSHFVGLWVLRYQIFQHSFSFTFPSVTLAKALRTILSRVYQCSLSFDKFLDLLSHLWIPTIVLGTAGTGLSKIRANLLDELHRPTYDSPRKGLTELNLVIKYPVRHSLNPFVSDLNDLFVKIISGETIVAVVLGLQTTGPLLLQALKEEDLYLASSLIMFLSFLAVLGTLFSDLCLMLLDPRIRRQAREGEMM